MADDRGLEKFPIQFDSLGVHAGLARSENGERDVPVYASTSFVFNDSAHGASIFDMTAEAFCYSRIANPTTDVLEKRVVALEGGESALATASGPAALFTTVTTLAQNGSNILIASPLSEASIHAFTHRLPALGITARFVSFHANSDVDQVRKAIDENTKAVFVESISIQDFQVADVETLAGIAHGEGVPLIVDNTYGAAGFFIRPISHGADIVIASTTPYLAISSSLSNPGGIIIDSGSFPWSSPRSRTRFPQFFEPSPGFHGLQIFEKFGKSSFIRFARIAVLRDIGPCLNPFEAALLIAGLETLSVRMERVSGNAKTLVDWLVRNERVKSVKYPGLTGIPSSTLSILKSRYLRKGYGGILAFTLEDADVEAVIKRLRLVSRGTSLGGNRTQILVDAPPTTPPLTEKNRDETKGERQSPAQVFISVGLENIDDVIRDFEQALERETAGE